MLSAELSSANQVAWSSMHGYQQPHSSLSGHGGYKSSCNGVLSPQLVQAPPLQTAPSLKWTMQCSVGLACLSAGREREQHRLLWFLREHHDWQRPVSKYNLGGTLPARLLQRVPVRLGQQDCPGWLRPISCQLGVHVLRPNRERQMVYVMHRSLRCNSVMRAPGRGLYPCWQSCDWRAI